MRAKLPYYTLLLLCPLSLCGCNGESPTQPTPPNVEAPEPAPPSSNPSTPPVETAQFDATIQQSPATVYGSTRPGFRWEVHGRVRVENEGDLLGHLVIVQLDVPGRKDRDWRYEEIRDFAGTDAIPVGKTLQIPFKLFFNWDKGFPQLVFATIFVRDEYGVMHKYESVWTIGD